MDDDASILHSLCDLVHVNGMHAEPFRDPADLLAHMARGEPTYPGPCCVVSDLKMGDIDGLELLRRMRTRMGEPFILMSGASSVRETVEAFHLGVIDVLLKPFEPAESLAALHKALGASLQEHAARERIASARTRWAALTPREQTVAELAAAGELNKVIAARLGVSERMIKLYRQHAMEKLGVDHVTALVRLLDTLKLDAG